MLSLPTGHCVNTYAPLEKKAAISAQPVGRERLLLWRTQWRVQSPAEDDRDAVSAGLCLCRAIVCSSERNAPDVHAAAPSTLLCL